MNHTKYCIGYQFPELCLNIEYVIILLLKCPNYKEILTEFFRLRKSVQPLLLNLATLFLFATTKEEIS